MNQGMVSTIIGAVVGGIVGAGVVFFAGSGSKIDLANLEVGNLKVASVIITEQAALLNKEGAPEVILKEGSILAENVILAKKFVGKQFQGHAIVANRLFTTPDDLIATPMEKWRFYAEIGSSAEAGGEIVVRSSAGPASVNTATNNGALIRVGFDTESQPQIIGLQNFNRSIMQIRNDLSDQQRQMLTAGQTAQPNIPGGTSYNSPMGTQLPGGETIPSVATQPTNTQ